LPFRPWFSILHGQVARDLLFNWLSLGQAISLSSFRRKPESRLLLEAFWIPACAGMTDQHLSEKVIWTRLIENRKFNPENKAPKSATATQKCRIANLRSLFSPPLGKALMTSSLRD
jgi:hypothetical protein